MKEAQFKFTKRTFLVPVISLALIWFIYVVEIIGGYNFNEYGIYPKTIQGLRGILFSPFIHSNVAHLMSNSVPLVVMLGCLFYFYQKIATKVLVLGILFTGILTWTIGRPSYHIGASGVIYFLVSFIFFSGVFRKYYRLAAVSLIVVFLYGSTIWYVLPIEVKISWEGHLSGFLVGFIFSLIYMNKGPQPEKFSFSENEEFENLFDENGNFNPPEEIVENSDKD